MDFWEQRGARLIRTSVAGLVASGAFWYQLGMVFFGISGLTAHIFGMMSTAMGHTHAASQWFVAGTAMWIGAFMILGFFIGPVSKARHRR